VLSRRALKKPSLEDARGVLAKAAKAEDANNHRLKKMEKFAAIKRQRRSRIQIRII
jgi:hypothetical protein